MKLWTLLCALVIAGCGPSASMEQDEVDPVGDDAVRPDARVGTACDQMDFLFVIDNSASMELEQQNLIANFPQFVEVLERFTNAAGRPIDYHVGVTTTGVSTRTTVDVLGFPVSSTSAGEDGHLQVGGCGGPRPWLERGDADVNGRFSCVADVGLEGATDEMPLEGARLALTERMADGSNAGFLRDEALLALVFLTDEEDCSRQDHDVALGPAASLCDTPTEVGSYVAAIDAVKGDRTRWATAVIAGVDPEPCSSALGDAAPATRLVDFAAEVGPNAVTSSICQDDLAGALAEAMATFQTACDDLGVE